MSLHKLISPYFSAHGTFVRANVPGDGSCFFHSLAVALNYCDCRKTRRVREAGLRLRSKIVDPVQYRRFLREREFSDLAPTAETARNPSVFADDFLISFAACRLRMSIVIIRDESTSIAVHPDARRVRHDGPCVILAWVNQVHFEPVMEIQASTNKNLLLGCFTLSHPLARRALMEKQEDKQEASGA